MDTCSLQVSTKKIQSVDFHHCEHKQLAFAQDTKLTEELETCSLTEGVSDLLVLATETLSCSCTDM